MGYERHDKICKHCHERYGRHFYKRQGIAPESEGVTCLLNGAQEFEELVSMPSTSAKSSEGVFNTHGTATGRLSSTKPMPKSQVPKMDPSAQRDKQAIDTAKVPAGPPPFDPFKEFVVDRFRVDTGGPVEGEQHPLQRGTRQPSPFGQSLWRPW